MQALLPVLSLLLLQLASAAPQTTSTSISYPLPAAPLPGIVEGATGITINSISIGALPDWSHENPRDVNAARELRPSSSAFLPLIDLPAQWAHLCPSSVTT